MHNYENFIDFDYYFNLFQPECVILETAEYATTRNYFNIDKLKAKRLNPPLSQVMHTPHDSYGLQELSCHTERKDGITTIEINLHSDYFVDKTGLLGELIPIVGPDEKTSDFCMGTGQSNKYICITREPAVLERRLPPTWLPHILEKGITAMIYLTAWRSVRTRNMKSI